MDNIDEIKKQYQDSLSNKIEKIEELIRDKKISKKMAGRLISFYIKKELLSDISTICKLDRAKKEKQILFTYQFNTRDYYAL